MSNTGHNDPPLSKSGSTPAGADHDLYAEHATRLRRVVGSRVKTSDANLDDACGFAWTQLLATGPSRGESIFAWLATVAVREAWRLHRLERRGAGDGVDLTIDSVEAPALSARPGDRATLNEIVEVLRTIHPRKRRMLLLHAAGFTCEEIAAGYGISVERARALVYKARLQVRERTEAD